MPRVFMMLDPVSDVSLGSLNARMIHEQASLHLLDFNLYKHHRRGLTGTE